MVTPGSAVIFVAGAAVRCQWGEDPCCTGTGSLASLGHAGVTVGVWCALYVLQQCYHARRADERLVISWSTLPMLIAAASSASVFNEGKFRDAFT